MAATQQFAISQKAQDAFIQYHKYCYNRMVTQWDFRGAMRDIDLAYIREQDYTQDQLRAKLANRLGDANKLQNVTIPVVKPQVRAAVQYQMAVFLDEYPILGVVSGPEFIDAAKQMQALVEENSIKGKWALELMLFFIDGFKYNLSAIECYWDTIITAALETDPSYRNGTEGKPKEIIWSGNKLKRWDMYNSYWDTVCTPQEISTKGDYAGTTELYTRTALKSLMTSLATKLPSNFGKAFAAPIMNPIAGDGNGPGFYLPYLNPDVIINQQLLTDNWDGWLGLIPESNNSNNTDNYEGKGKIFEVSREYVRIIPKEFSLDVPASGTPQIWKLWIVNHSVVIAAERQTNAHEMIPVLFGQPSEDGLGYQAKSLATDGKPFQQVASTLMNSVMAARRRAVGDRVLFDPSRISEGHMNNPSPTAKIPVRPSAYGKPVGEAVFPFPYRDDQSGTDMQGISMVVNLANSLAGQNNVRQGQFVKGNKTDGQWQDVMSNATSSDRAYSLVYEAQVFTPMKEILKLNYIQYQQPTSVYDSTNKVTTKVDPIALRNATLNFKVTDGYLPKDKVIDSDSMKVAAQVIGSSPALSSGYNVAQLFSYLFKTQNVDFTPFEKSPAQQAYEQALGIWNNAAMEAAKHGAELKQPMPLPEQYGYNPNQAAPGANNPQANTANAGSVQPNPVAGA